MQRRILLWLMVCNILVLSGCAAKTTNDVIDAVDEQSISYENAEASKEIQSENIVRLETSFRRYDDRHNELIYQFVMQENSYSEMILEETSAMHTKVLFDEEHRKQLQELFQKYALFAYNGTDVTAQDNFSGENIRLYVTYDSGEVLAFRIEDDPYAEWTLSFLELYEDAQKQNVVEELVENTNYSIGDRLVGSYSGTGTEEDATYEITLVDGHLYLEYRSIYEYWGAEFEPDEADGIGKVDTETLRGTFYPYSGFSMAGNYWNNGIPTTLTKTGEGVELNPHPTGEGTLKLVRNEDVLPVHKYPEATEEVDKNIIGIWRMESDTEDAFVQIQKDGTIRAVLKENGKPTVMECGTIQSAENGALVFETQRFAFGSMPSSYDLEYNLTGKSLLLRLREGTFLGRPEGSKFILQKSEEGKRSGNLNNGPLTQRLDSYTVTDGFADDQGRYYLQEADGDGLYYIDASTTVEEDGITYAFLEGDDAVTWIARLLDPMNGYTEVQGIYDITVTGGHIDCVHAMTSAFSQQS